MQRPRRYRILHSVGIELLTAEYGAHRFVPHSHEYAVLAITEAGEAGWQGHSISARLGPGTVLFIPPNVVHAARSLGSHPWRYRALYLASDRYDAMVARCETECGRTVATAVIYQDARLAERLREMHREFERGAADGAVQSALDSMMVDLEPVLERSAPRRAAVGADSPLVQRAREIIDAEPARRWTLGTIAAACAVSPYHLCHAFRRQFGSSPYAYAFQRRVNSARALLCSERSISAVAHDLGFADHSHFSRAFFQVFGLTPREYRIATRVPAAQDYSSEEESSA